MDKFVIGVDVGTGSARAGVFDPQGRMLASAVAPIQIWKPRPEHVEQSSEDIWQAVGIAIRSALSSSGVRPEQIVGLSYDATCSLVVLDANNQPLPVNSDGDATRNIIVWMDHRALKETDEINGGGYDVLKYVGGKLSPEMETPKLKWLKTNLPQTWAKAGKFLDLADFLTYKSTGADVRSLCTVVCKWTYLGQEGETGRWDKAFFGAIGLEDLFDNDRVVSDVRPMGTRIGNLSPEAAESLGLTSDCAVGIGIIDAHAGGLGVLGAILTSSSSQHSSPDTQPLQPSASTPPDLSRLETALALITGTSNCHMAVSSEPRFIPGIWGPYYGAMVPSLWLTEGGQSAAGSAIDHVIADHAHAPQLNAQALMQNVTVYQLLNAELERLRHEASLPYLALLTRDIHVLPDFLGNRSPYADPHARAIIDGLTLDESFTSHALYYYATLQATAYGTRDIVRAMNEAGYEIETLFVTGGGTKNPLWLQEHADATGLTLILPRESEAVLLGSAMLAATAAGLYDSVPAAMQGMSATGQIIAPNPETAAYHTAKFALFRALYTEQKNRHHAMASFAVPETIL